jgi:hypothetical protein
MKIICWTLAAVLLALALAVRLTFNPDQKFSWSETKPD